MSKVNSQSQSVKKAALVADLARTNEELRRLKTRLISIKSASRRGRYLPMLEFANLQCKIDGLKNKSQRLQNELGALKGPPPESKPTMSNSDNADAGKQDGFDKAKQRLSDLRARTGTKP
jgi:hypothetical protein